jgi:hypothetical protein
VSDDIRVLIPSYKRPYLKSPTQEYLPFAKLVVMESEAAAYRMTGNDVIECPDSAQGNLCRVRNWILDQNQDARGVLILDDDIRHIVVWENQKDRVMSAGEVEEFIYHGFSVCEEWGLNLWGINMLFDKGAYREGAPFTTVRTIGGPWQAHRPNPLRYDETLPLKEDYDISLQHMLRYRGVLRFNKYVYVAAQVKQAGGCATYRSIEREKAQFLALQSKWGSRIVQRDHGNDKEKVRGEGVKKTIDLNPRIVSPLAGV